MTDTPSTPPSFPPPHWTDRLKTTMGDLARPFAMYAVSGGEAWSILQGKDAGVITAGGVVLAALYASKTVEVQQAGKQDAQVKIAQANAGATV